MQKLALDRELQLRGTRGEDLPKVYYVWNPGSKDPILLKPSGEPLAKQDASEACVVERQNSEGVWVQISCGEHHYPVFNISSRCWPAFVRRVLLANHVREVVVWSGESCVKLCMSGLVVRALAAWAETLSGGPHGGEFRDHLLGALRHLSWPPEAGPHAADAAAVQLCSNRNYNRYSQELVANLAALHTCHRLLAQVAHTLETTQPPPKKPDPPARVVIRPHPRSAFTLTRKLSRAALQ